MKILHLCLGIEHYIDSWGYQQNLLPLYHSKIGNDVIVLASNDTYPKFLSRDIISSIKLKGDEYFNGPVKVIRSSSYFNHFIHFQKAKGLLDKLRKEKPDLIFFHGCFNLSIISCVIYKKQNPSVTLVVDNHGDDFNINSNKLYRIVFLKLFWRNLHRYIKKWIDCYYGVTKSRCELLTSYLNIEKTKIKLLPIGADVYTYELVKENRLELRDRYSFKEQDIIIVHGGKLDKRKGTVDLIRAYRLLKDENSNLRLVLFGKMLDQEIIPLIDNDIIVFDWLSRIQVFELFKLADLAVWPIHHTTLIEDTIAAKLPYLIKKTDTTQHLINSDFYLRTGSEKELIEKIKYFINFQDKECFQENTLKIYDSINYYNIAKKAMNVT